MRDAYAGDVAWTEWFERCCVAKCADGNRAKLTEQIRSAMFAQLARFGFSAGVVDECDPISFFDAFFLAHGDRETHKPLKSYFLHRIAVERLRLKDFVCGTLFSARFGRIHDVVRDWIADAKGWRPHALVGADGRRRVSWESAAPEEDVREACGGARTAAPGGRLDRGIYRECVQGMLETISSKIKVEKSAIAFLLHAMAQGKSVSSPEVLARLKVRKSRAHQLKGKVMEQVEKYLSENGIDAGNVDFARVMIAECDRERGEEA